MAKTKSKWTPISIVPKLNSNVNFTTKDLITSDDSDADEGTDASGDIRASSSDTVTSPQKKRLTGDEKVKEDFDQQVLEDIESFSGFDVDDLVNPDEDIDDEEDEPEHEGLGAEEEAGGADTDADNDDSNAVETVEPTVAAKEEPKVSRAEKRIKDLIEKRKQDALNHRNELAETITPLLQEIQQLRARLSRQDADLAGVMVESTDKRILLAKDKLRAAKEAMDTDAELDALEELQEAKIAKMRAQELAAKAPQVSKEAPPTITTVDVAARNMRDTWIRQNEALVKNPTIASVIQNVAQGVEEEGYAPYMPEYYEEVNSRLNKRFERVGINVRAKSIDSFVDDDMDLLGLMSTDNNDESGDGDGGEEEIEPVVQPKVKKAINPVSGGIKSPAGTTTIGKASSVKRQQQQERVKLGAAEVAIAKNMNVDPVVLLKQRALLNRGIASNGVRLAKGYSEVFIPKKK